MSDDGGYWESNDEAVLRAQFGRYGNMLHTLQMALNNFKSEQTDRPESLAGRLEQFLKERCKQ